MIRRIGVVGAGSMGAAVAALAASAGLDVVLLDVKGEDDPAGPARRGLQRAAQQRAFLNPSAIDRVRVGNVEDDLAWLTECDWVLEAIIENRDAKRDLFRRLDAVLSPETIVTTNTSTFTLAQLLPAELGAWRERFFVTHFFNPPRALLLCEVTAFPEGRPRALRPSSASWNNDWGDASSSCAIHLASSPTALAFMPSSMPSDSPVNSGLLLKTSMRSLARCWDVLDQQPSGQSI